MEDFRDEVIERQFALMNRTGPTVKLAVQQIKYECLRYAHALLREQGDGGIEAMRDAQIREVKKELEETLAIITINKEIPHAPENEIQHHNDLRT